MASNSHISSIFNLNTEHLLEVQRKALAQVEAGVSIVEVLTQLASSIEAQAIIKATISILSRKEEKKLVHCVTSALPRPFYQALDGVELDCDKQGSSPFRSEPVYTRDIATDPLWARYQSIALESGWHACWSMPIHAISSDLLGIVACYFAQGAMPSETDIQVLQLTAHAAGLVMERNASKQTATSAASKYRQIFNSATDFAIMSTDLLGRVTEWNEGASRILGWSEEEVLGQRLHLIFTPDDVANGRPEKEMECALLQDYSPDERWHLRKSGERFWAVGQLTPLKNDAGEVLGFVKILRDRTAYKEVDTRLQELTATLEKEVAERTHERDRIWRNSMDLLLVIGPEGVLHAINPAWTAILGYEPEDLVGKYFEPFVHPEDVQPTVAAILQAAQGPLMHFEVRIRHKNGAYHWVQWRAAPEAGLIYANGRDVTIEKQQAEQLAQANEARLQIALEAGEMGAWEWNPQTNKASLLQGATAVHGLAAVEGSLEMSMHDYLQRFVHPDDRHVIEAIMAQAVAEGNRHRSEYRIIRPDGSIHWVESRGHMFMDEAGTPTKMLGVVVDITRRKRAEHDFKFLAQASMELASLVDPQSTLDRLAFLAVPHFADWCAIDLLQEDGTLKRVAVAHSKPEKVQMAYDLVRRFPPDPAQRQGSWNIIRTGQAQLIRQLTDEILEQSIPNKEYLAALKELGLRSYLGVPLSAHGKVWGVVGFIAAESGRLFNNDDLALAEDLARRAAIALENAELYGVVRQSDHAKDVFLATLAHELRNPLAAISGGLGLIELVKGDAQRVEQYGQLIQRQTNHLTRLVDDLMDVSRISTGKIELKKESTSVATLLNHAIETSRSELEAGQHQLTVTLSGTQTDIYADPVRLTQVFSNLLINAARYTNPGGKIDVLLEGTANEYIVRFKDNGIGIAPNQLKDIFKIFTQVTHPIQRTRGGLGIGLSLVDGLLKLHGGRVEAFSPGLGKGSEFVVHLPCSKEPQTSFDIEPENRPAKSPEKMQKRRILVVDDNVDAAMTITEILRILGHEVKTVHDGLAAVLAAEEMRPDIILLDIGLPGIDGYEVARRIRAAESNAPRTTIVALTGWGQDQDKQRAHEAGCDHHWVKPVGLPQLEQLLQPT